MPNGVVDKHTKALEFFKDWSNYLLVTTVAALGWVASEKIEFSNVYFKPFCVWFLAFSIVFGIFTLALIPLIQEQRSGNNSIYDVRAKFFIFIWEWPWPMKVKSVCFAQHAFFILGTLAYSAATTGNDTLHLWRALWHFVSG